ncbi:unnamed protein product [Cylicocyclus nassatus]|uniref:Uncharacterized protein n=1 Tax=Cylicocyclus nassatus TaxID=53992 RepID=A0AA36MHE7_CYLNA|nr:unnamed protein product [Cylicocyclus nassatus]
MEWVSVCEVGSVRKGRDCEGKKGYGRGGDRLTSVAGGTALFQVRDQLHPPHCCDSLPTHFLSLLTLSLSYPHTHHLPHPHFLSHPHLRLLTHPHALIFTHLLTLTLPHSHSLHALSPFHTLTFPPFSPTPFHTNLPQIHPPCLLPTHAAANLPERNYIIPSIVCYHCT